MKSRRNMDVVKILGGISFGLVALIFTGCNSESPGLEYMPDMYRSPAIEPYVDNAEFGNTNIMSAREPVKGTIPRGYMPFSYENTPEDFERAGQELKNPIPLDEKTLEEGKNLYGMMCKHCHGAKGDGKGSITNPVYGAVPSYSDAQPTRRGERAMKDLKAGHIYHTIMYGLNAMGPHDHITTQEERWKIVHFVQSLQDNKNSESESNVGETAEVGTTQTDSTAMDSEEKTNE